MPGRAALLTLLLLAAPLCASEPTVVSDDPTGDVEASDGQGASVPVGDVPGLDIVQLRMLEEESDFTLEIELAGQTDPSGVELVEAGFFEVSFMHGDVAYRIFIDEAMGQSSMPYATLWRLNPGDAYFAEAGSLETARPGDAIAVRIPRDALIDEDGAAPFLGRALTELAVTVRHQIPSAMFAGQQFAGLENAHIGDRAPDAGGASYEVTLGGLEAQGAELTALTPVRSSNGEASTFVFEILAGNPGDEEETFFFEALDAPDGWQIDVWPASLSLEPGGRGFALATATIPFAHQHGITQMFKVRMSDAEQAAYATTELDIHFVEIPQPAGHHDTLFLHGRHFESMAQTVNPVVGSTDSEQFMNTREPESPVLLGGSVRAEGTTTATQWFFHLEPGLDIGLVFADGGESGGGLTLVAGRPVLDAELNGRLIWLEPIQDATPSRFPPYDGREAITVANLTGPAFTMGQGESLELEFSLDMNRALAGIEYQRGANLVLEVEVREAMVLPPPTSAAGIRLQSGGSFQLPLLEYTEQPDFRQTAPPPFHLEAAVPSAVVRQGGKAILEAALTSASDEDLHMSYDILGPGKAAVMQSRLPALLQAGATVPLEFILDAQGRSIGDRLDTVLVVTAEGADHASVARYAVSVGDGPDAVDDTAELASRTAHKDAPAGTWGILVLALAALAVGRREP